ncbi:hypothetical protein Leryth_027071 [Lithospermum erythrorhizon]|nr:hypothetical protein Leryth_027071 [Lithospermum erythrorhizon]
MSIKDVHSKAELDKVLEDGKAVILHFWATWCEASKQMDQVFAHLSTDFPHAHFLRFWNNPRFIEIVPFQVVPCKVMLFMKGKPEEPKCGFSRKVVDILRQIGLFKLVYFSIISCQSELLGGSDIVLEMQKSGSRSFLLKEIAFVSVETLLRCFTCASYRETPVTGFSSKVVNALKEDGIDFGSFDILTDDAVRQGLKTYSNWPTFPQLYYKGELMGGCDIVLEMKSSLVVS